MIAKAIAARMIQNGSMPLRQIAEFIPRLSMEQLEKIQAEVSSAT